MFRLTGADPPPDQVRRIAFVPFLADGRCVLIETPEGPTLPAGEVLDGEDYLIDSVLRIPLRTAGFLPCGVTRSRNCATAVSARSNTCRRLSGSRPG
jgi:hypothetical protein